MSCFAMEYIISIVSTVLVHFTHQKCNIITFSTTHHQQCIEQLLGVGNYDDDNDRQMDGKDAKTTRSIQFPIIRNYSNTYEELTILFHLPFHQHQRCRHVTLTLWMTPGRKQKRFLFRRKDVNIEFDIFRMRIRVEKCTR